MTDTTFGEKLIESAKQAEEHAAGKMKLRSCVVEIIPVPNYKPQQIKNIRTRLGLTQGLMGGIVGVSTKTVDARESGYRKPSSSECAYLFLSELNTNLGYFSKITRVER